MVMLPAFSLSAEASRSMAYRKLRAVVSKAFGLYIFIIPLFLWQLFLAPYFPQTNGLINDWYNLVNYCTFFFFGLFVDFIEGFFFGMQ
jgi:hypothetical protein